VEELIGLVEHLEAKQGCEAASSQPTQEQRKPAELVRGVLGGRQREREGGAEY
jgi:hypothetical protein